MQAISSVLLMIPIPDMTSEMIVDLFDAKPQLRGSAKRPYHENDNPDIAR